jgi:hypothetical protein
LATEEEEVEDEEEDEEEEIKEIVVGNLDADLMFVLDIVEEGNFVPPVMVVFTPS